MKNIIITLSIISFAMLYSMCDDVDMYSLAKNGPKPEKIFIYDSMISSVPGNFNGKDPMMECLNAASTFPQIQSKTRVFPFLSTDERNIKDIVPEVFSDVPVYGINNGAPYFETLISSTWSNLWLGTINPLVSPIGPATGIGSLWWSGSTMYGLRDIDTCENWTNGSSSAWGKTGKSSEVTSVWIADSQPTCSSLANVICITY